LLLLARSGRRAHRKFADGDVEVVAEIGLSILKACSIAACKEFALGESHLLSLRAFGAGPA
jgi:hypothetical protein